MEGPENPRKDTKMDNDSITESTTKQETKYPRGLRCFERWDRPSKPYLVQRTIDGRRETESYTTQEDRDRRARQWAESSRASLRGFEPTRSELIEFRAFKGALGGDDWRDIIAYWRRVVRVAESPGSERPAS